MNVKWEKGAPAPLDHLGHTSVELNGLVYVGGGYETGGRNSYMIDSYNPLSNSWGPPIYTPYCQFAMTTLNNNLIMAGGLDKNYKRTNQILIMNLSNNHFKNYTKMSISRSSTTASGHQGMLIITGGLDEKSKTLSSTELYDSNNGQWYDCSDLPQPHSHLSSVVLGNTLYLLGGNNIKGHGSLTVFTSPLDALSNHQLKWNTHQDVPCCHSAPVSVHGTHLLIVGGYKRIENKNIFTSEVYKLSTATQSWQAIGHIPSTRSSSAAVSIANRIIIIGGWNDKEEITNTLWIGSFEL